VFGAKRLPEMGKSLGHGLRGFKESISGEDSAAHLEAAPARIDELPKVGPEPEAERIPARPAA
jgi:Sec-independent protein translocase protein TatA